MPFELKMGDKVEVNDSLRDKVITDITKERYKAPRPSITCDPKSPIRHPIFCC
jgi:hypothetical protein